MPVVISENLIQMPVFRSRKTETTVRIPDGQTIGIGGLMSEVSVAVEDKTPLLGDIPIVGKAFRTEIEEQFQNQLFFFIRAQVLDAAGVPVTKAP